MSREKGDVSSYEEAVDMDSVNSLDTGVVATEIASSVEDPKSTSQVHFILQLLTCCVTLLFTYVCLETEKV